MPGKRAEENAARRRKRAMYRRMRNCQWSAENADPQQMGMRIRRVSLDVRHISDTAISECLNQAVEQGGKWAGRPLRRIPVMGMGRAIIVGKAQRAKGTFVSCARPDPVGGYYFDSGYRGVARYQQQELRLRDAE